MGLHDFFCNGENQVSSLMIFWGSLFSDQPMCTSSIDDSTHDSFTWELSDYVENDNVNVET
jgi:hypothetical protein